MKNQEFFENLERLILAFNGHFEGKISFKEELEKLKNVHIERMEVKFYGENGFMKDLNMVVDIVDPVIEITCKVEGKLNIMIEQAGIHILGGSNGLRYLDIPAFKRFVGTQFSSDGGELLIQDYPNKQFVCRLLFRRVENRHR